MKKIFFLATWLLTLTACKEAVPTPLFTPVSLGLTPEIDLRDVYFPHPDTGYAVGGFRFESTTLLRSQDGGQNWEPLFPIDTIDRVMYTLLQGQAGQILAGGLHDELLMLNPGEEDWRPRLVFFNIKWQPIRDFAQIDDSTLIAAAGGGYDRGILMHSRNGGLSWGLIDTFNLELRALAFPEPNTGFAAGFGVIYRSLDRGMTWELTPAEGDFFVSLDFPTPDVGYAAGRGGTLLKTQNGGDTWEVLRNGNNLLSAGHRYSKLFFLDEETGYVVGDRGLLRKTSNGGNTWQTLDLGIKQDLFGIYVFQEGKGIVVGDEGMMGWFEE